MPPTEFFGRGHWLYKGLILESQSEVNNSPPIVRDFPLIFRHDRMCYHEGQSILFYEYFSHTVWSIDVCCLIFGSHRERYFYRGNKLFPRDSV